MDDERTDMTSYGKTQKLCNVAKNLGNWCYEAAMKWDEASQ